MAKTKKASSSDGDSSAASKSSNNNETTNKKQKNKNGLLFTAVLVAIAAVAYAVLQSTQIHSVIITEVDTMVGGGGGIKNNISGVILPYQQFFGNIMAGNPTANKELFKEQWNKLQASIATASSPSALQTAAAIGYKLKDTHKAKHPVFMVPGFVTSGLELWEGHECAVQYFRRKIWGSLETFRSFATDSECWKVHLSLDARTGKDPEGIRLRPSQGFEAADFWTSAFWVWDRVIRNLAAVGYDGSNMDMVSYDLAITTI